MLYDFLPPTSILDSALSFWQSNTWQKILLTSGQAKDVFYFGNKDSSYLLIEIRSIGLGLFGAFSLWVNASQVWNDFPDYMNAVKGILKAKGVIFFQIEPIEEIPFYWDKHISSFVRYKRFLTPQTRVLLLDNSENTLLWDMHEKGRYNIRLAEKRWVKVEKVSSSSENIDIWMQLLTDTTNRDGFSHNTKKYYMSFIENLEKQNQWWLYFAFFEWRIIAGSIFVFTPSRAIYYYGASVSDPSDRKHMAPYLLQWHAICHAKSRGIPIYDFLWVADPKNPKDSLRSVSDFKAKFWWCLEFLPRELLIPVSPLWYIFGCIRKLRW
jgi:FemAB family